MVGKRKEKRFQTGFYNWIFMCIIADLDLFNFTWCIFIEKQSFHNRAILWFYDPDQYGHILYPWQNSNHTFGHLPKHGKPS